MAWPGEKPSEIKLGGLKASANPAIAYPGAIYAVNVRFPRYGGVVKRNGFTKFNTTQMPATVENVAGIHQFISRSGTKYIIVNSTTKIFLCPSSGAWTALKTGLSSRSSEGVKARTFNNELIIVDGVNTPQVTDGTAGNTGDLVAQSATQVRTSMTTAQILSYGLHAVSPTTLIAAAGQSATGTYDALTQEYDTIGDVWATRQRATVNRSQGVGYTIDGIVHLSSGLTTGAALDLNGERYNPVTNTWTIIGNTIAARRQGVGASANNGGFSITGNDNAGSDAWTTANYFYDPVKDAWATKTAISTDPARRGAAGFVISQEPHVISGTVTAADAYDAEHGSYNPFTDAWTDRTDITAARAFAGGVQGQDNLGYVVAGMNSSDADQTTIYSYNHVTAAWSTSSAALSVAKNTVGCAVDDWMMYMAGGAVGSTPNVAMERYNTSPAPPIAKYIEVFKGQVFMSCSSSFPSRVWYSAPGNSRVWEPFAYFDVNPDDGDVINGMFVYEGRLYVAKRNAVYQIAGDAPFDPMEHIAEPIKVEGVSGSIMRHGEPVVTNHGVYYRTEYGFVRFDGTKATDISEPIQSEIDAWAQAESLAIGTVGVWSPRTDEVWFSTLTTASSATDYSAQGNRTVVYNYRLDKWCIWQGILTAQHRMMKVEDPATSATSNDAVLISNTGSTDGYIYKMDTGTSDNGSSIASTYQTGWFSPFGGVEQALPKDMFMWWKRVSTTAPVVALRANYAASDTAEGGTTFTDTITLTASAQLPYFFDGADQRCRVAGAAAATSHALSLRITETSTNAAWELYGAILTSVQPLTDGRVVQ